jgi:hypothetical protein
MSLYNLDHKPEFPKLKYASTGGAVMVHSATEERALGLGWGDNDPSPAPIEDAEDAAPVKKAAKK